MMSNKIARDLFKALLGAFQKGLMLFVELKTKGSRRQRLVDLRIRAYLDWYKSGMYHQGIRTVRSLCAPASATRGVTTGSIDHLG